VAAADHAPIPLCIDLDGTLVRTDMLHETMLLLAKTSPLSLAALPRWLVGGRALLKHMIAERVSFDAALLPYRSEVLELIAEAKEAGRPVVLTTAAARPVAEAVAEHLGLFDEIISSDHQTNLSATRKAEALSARFGDRGFDYVGDSRADLPVLRRARQGFLVVPSGRRPGGLRNHGDLSLVPGGRGGFSAWLKAVRVHQWLKNGLIVVPLAAAHQLGNLELLAATVIAFVSFSLCASSVYILNDLLDLAADRGHHRKKNRPFASGELPVAAGVAAAPLLLAAAAGLALFTTPLFLMVLGFYYVLTTLYSFWLKRQVIVDVTLLAMLYTIRIVAGSAATGIRLSFWLLALSMFLFLCLALVKRYSELRLAVDDGQTLSGRGYLSSDLPVILALGTGSGMVSVLIMAMYTQSSLVPEMYPASEWLWVPPLLILYWVTRLWLKAQRGEIHDDPVVFAATDWQSLSILALMGAAFGLAASGLRFW
jgi:4-hydroxybenzoate polyprenyltransferase/phosphoserine phosphatase